MTATIPPLAPEVPMSLPSPVTRTLESGLTVTAVRRATIPIAEIRLSIPMAGVEPATADLLTATLTGGTTDSSLREIAQRLQGFGGNLNAGADPDRFAISGYCLSTALPDWLATLGELLVSATFPADVFNGEQERIVDSISVAEQQPGYVVNRALNMRLWGSHPYGDQHPGADEFQAVTRDVVHEQYRQRVNRSGAHLTIVGDIDEDGIFDLVADRLSQWAEGNRSPAIAPLPSFTTGPLEIVDRPGSVQSVVRVAFPGVERTHPDNAAQHLTNLIYGGYFSSRLVLNLREEKGYGYAPRSVIDHSPAGTYQLTTADVATEVTADALREIHWEITRLGDTDVPADELEQARQYALGALKIGTATNAGLASFMSSLAFYGLSLDWIKEHASRIQDVTAADVKRVAAQRLDLEKSVTVVLGEAKTIAEPLQELTSVTVQS